MIIKPVVKRIGEVLIEYVNYNYLLIYKVSHVFIKQITDEPIYLEG